MLACIHGNLEALEAVVEDATRQSVDRLVCLGDMIGFGADPAACVAKVSSTFAWSGQPRDENPKACYAILEDGSIRVRRVAYDIEKAVSKILTITALSPINAERLRVGR